MAIHITPELEEAMLEELMSRLSGNKSTLCIMKGAITTDFSDLTHVTSRSDDVLLEYTPQSTTETTGNDRSARIYTGQVTATTSGTASWFWLYHPVDHTSGSSEILYQMIGTIGTSGSDLNIPTTTVTSGLSYNVNNLILKLPNTF